MERTIRCQGCGTTTSAPKNSDPPDWKKFKLSDLRKRRRKVYIARWCVYRCPKCLDSEGRPKSGKPFWSIVMKDWRDWEYPRMMQMARLVFPHDQVRYPVLKEALIKSFELNEYIGWDTYWDDFHVCPSDPSVRIGKERLRWSDIPKAVEA
jgi:hypothetical protein